MPRQQEQGSIIDLQRLESWAGQVGVAAEAGLTQEQLRENLAEYDGFIEGAKILSLMELGKAATKGLPDSLPIHLQEAA